MKVIERFFQLLSLYQKQKHCNKIEFEKFKTELMIYYHEKIR